MTLMWFVHPRPHDSPHLSPFCPFWLISLRQPTPQRRQHYSVVLPPTILPQSHPTHRATFGPIMHNDATLPFLPVLESWHVSCLKIVVRIVHPLNQQHLGLELLDTWPNDVSRHPTRAALLLVRSLRKSGAEYHDKSGKRLAGWVSRSRHFDDCVDVELVVDDCFGGDRPVETLVIQRALGTWLPCCLHWPRPPRQLQQRTMWKTWVTLWLVIPLHCMPMPVIN
mmetsp:Transcript_14523/g.29984  ORF Transcript_14523/g.29984 Transcript_14523/m.29984 type:complete len:224 (-) Transcript_14523:828-1499(-)